MKIYGLLYIIKIANKTAYINRMQRKSRHVYKKKKTIVKHVSLAKIPSKWVCGKWNKISEDILTRKQTQEKNFKQVHS